MEDSGVSSTSEQIKTLLTDYCRAKARNFLNWELKDKEKAEMEEITTLRVCQRTLITFNKEIFGQKQNEILSKEQCLNKFKNDGIAWIFNSSSIRGVMYENIEKNE